MDEPAYVAQRIVNAACIQAEIPCVYALNQYNNGRTFEVHPLKSGCVDCLLEHTSRRFPSFFKLVDALTKEDF